MNEKHTNLEIGNSDERGAALVMALLITFLLLVGCAGLLLEASTNTMNVTDATAEQQAYNAAESGIQQAVHILRDNVILPDDERIDPTKPATDKANRIDFVKALKLETSNEEDDASTVPRLSRWIKYSDAFNDRVTLGSESYIPMTGHAYSLQISDPDNTGSRVTYHTTGRIFEHDDGVNTRKTYGSGANTVVIEYQPFSATNLDVSSGVVTTEFGRFLVTITGTGASIPAFNRFEIVVRMTQPYPAVRVMRGYIQTNTSPTSAPRIIFDAQTYTLMGSQITLGFPWGSPQNVQILGPPQRWGYEAQMSTGANVIVGTLTAPEPTRLLIRSTGFGPRGSTKQLEAIIQKDFFDGLTAPATLTLVGPDVDTTGGRFTFNPGSSAVTVYSGVDAESTDIIPPIGTVNTGNLEVVMDSVDGEPPFPFNGTVIGAPSDISEEVPHWLSTPLALDATLRGLYSIANASSRYFPTGTQPTTFGDNTTGMGITFCDGDCELSGNGGGIMVVTGTLTLRGNFNFNGMIIVTGAGGVTRSGGGTGTIQGNMVVSPYSASYMADNIPPLETDRFLAPQYDLSGGGNSEIMYNSRSVQNGLVAVSNFVLGVAEK
ncbi:MAG: hypothetical protein QUS14_10800 [Pyrinomonadaceae bacterium]|nr:hypothetical protein [Pyrinomonadaceae bacterium]